MSFRRCRLTWNPSLTYQLHGQIYLKLWYFEARKFTPDKQMTSSFPYISLRRSPQQALCLPEFKWMPFNIPSVVGNNVHLQGFCVYTFLVDVTSYTRQLKKYFRLLETVAWNHTNVFRCLLCSVFKFGTVISVSLFSCPPHMNCMNELRDKLSLYVTFRKKK